MMGKWKMETELLIKKLSTQPPNSSFADVKRAYFLGWVALLLMTAVIWGTQLHLRPDYSYSLWGSARFWLGNSAWAVAAFLCAHFAFRSSLPDSTREAGRFLGLGLFLVFLGLVSGVQSASSWGAEAWGELSFFRGRCGLIIFATGLLSGAGLIVLLRRAASTRALATGAWTGAATGLFAASAMQWVCEKENSLHLLLWHVFPVFILAGLGSLAANRILRW